MDWKAKALGRILAEEVGQARIPPIQVVPMEDPWHYRSKMEFSFGEEGGRIILGLHQRGSFQRIVNLLACPIGPPGVSELLEGIRSAAGRFPLRAYHPKTHQGFWRHAVVRSSSSGDLMLLLVTGDGPREPVEGLAAELSRAAPALKSVYWGVSTRVSDVAQPERTAFLLGSETLEDRVGDLRFEIRPAHFVQPNLRLAGRVYEAIRDSAALSGSPVVYDLYCGTGLIALSLARQARWVWGVESDPENVSSAERNALLNGIANATFLCGKVEDLLRRQALFKVGPAPEVIVVDPPRAGLHPEACGPLLGSGAAALIYLSCNPASMARDLKVLLAREPRYDVASVSLFDFFPQTAHMEVLAVLRRR